MQKACGPYAAHYYFFLFFHKLAKINRFSIWLNRKIFKIESFALLADFKGIRFKK
jgi:hypothetical protein